MTQKTVQYIGLGISILLGVFIFFSLENSNFTAQLSKPSLGSSVDILSAYTVPSICDNTMCPPLLWISAQNIDGSAIKEGDGIRMNIYKWDAAIQDYSLTGTEGKNVITPEREIAAVSFSLNNIDQQGFEEGEYFYILESIIGTLRTLWTVQITYTNANQAPTILVSKSNTRLTPMQVHISSSQKVQQSSVPSLQISSSSAKSIQHFKPVSFSDVPKGAPLYTALTSLTSRGIVQGYSDGTFRPINFVNRAEAAKFLIVAKFGGAPDLQFKQQFSDIEPNVWYIPFILYASELGIIEGYPDGTFRPDEQVSTVEFIAMISRTFTLEQNLPYQYIDIEPSDWFARYAGNAELFGLLPKRPNYVLYPHMKMTREEVALAIDTLLTRLGL